MGGIREFVVLSGRLQWQIRRAFLAHPERQFRTAELARWAYPRLTGAIEDSFPRPGGNSHSSLDRHTPDQAYFTPLPIRMAA
jgi:hypothetical protein